MSDNSSFELRSAISLRPEFRSQFAGPRRPQRRPMRQDPLRPQWPPNRPVACSPQGLAGRHALAGLRANRTEHGPTGYVSDLAGMIAHPVDRAPGRDAFPLRSEASPPRDAGAPLRSLRRAPPTSDAPLSAVACSGTRPRPSSRVAPQEWRLSASRQS